MRAGASPPSLTIEAVELVDLRLPLIRPFHAREGVRTSKRILLLRLEAKPEPELSSVERHANLVGWAECVALQEPGYTAETAESAWQVLTEEILPSVPGSSFRHPRELPAGAGRIEKRIESHPMAAATLEMAGWDAVAKARGRSLAETLRREAMNPGEAVVPGEAMVPGGAIEPCEAIDSAAADPGALRSPPASVPRSISVGVSIGFMEGTEELIRTVERYLERGYARIKVKIGPGRDAEILRALRRRFGPDLDLWADANGAYGSDDVDTLRRLDDFGLGLLEQPLPAADLEGHARLQDMLETPLCLDESIESVDDLETALVLEACRAVNVKPGRVGGLAEAVEIHDCCLSAGVPAWVGGMLEGGVGRAHNLALASLPGFTLPGDLSESARYFERDLVEPPFVLRDGRMPVPTGPGIGVEPDLDFIRSLTARSARFD